MQLAAPTVETVLGPVAADRLGIVLPHEHFPLFWGAPPAEAGAEPFAPPPGYRPRLEQWQREALREAVGYGAGTLVEVTPIGLILPL